MKNIMLLIFFSIMAHISFGQEKNIDRSQELKIGDIVKEIPRSQIINYNKSTFDYSKSKGKLLLLDFFNTGCSSCIAKMPALEKIQKEMNGQLEIVMVTCEDKATMERFYKNNKYLKEHECKLPTIVADTSLIKLFPYNSVSHLVWIFDHKVKAISYPDYVNQENIQKVIKGEAVEIPIKNDFEVVEIQAKGSSTDTTGANVIGQVELTAYNPKLTLNGLKIEYDSIAGIQTAYINNISIIGAFTSSRARIKHPTYFLIKDRYEWHVNDPEQYEYFESETNPYRLWAEKNAICYKRISKRKLSDSTWARLIMCDISEFLQIDVSWEMKRRKCLIISKTQKTVSEAPTEAMTYEDSESLAFMLDFKGIFPPAIDEAKYKGYLKIPGFKTVEELNKHLSRYGLVLKEEWREIEVLVVRER